MSHQIEMNEVLSSHPDVTRNKYIRVMIFTFLNFLLNVPVNIALLVLVATGTGAFNGPYGSWAAVHAHFNDIPQITAQEWGSDKLAVFLVKAGEWAYVLEAVCFFAIFGTTPEARRRYHSALSCILVKFGLKKEQSSPELSDIMFCSNSPGRSRLGRCVLRRTLHKSTLFSSDRQETSLAFNSSSRSSGTFDGDIRSTGLTDEEEKECGRRDVPNEDLQPTNRNRISELPTPKNVLVQNTSKEPH